MYPYPLCATDRCLCDIPTHTIVLCHSIVVIKRAKMYPFKPYSTILLAGTTNSGKSTLASKFLIHRNEMFENGIDKILYCYSIWQDLFTDLEQSIDCITFYKGLPPTSLIDEHVNGGSKLLIVLDDMMHEISNNKEICLLFTQGAHHKRISVIYLSNNLFIQGKEARSIACNCHITILLNSPRNTLQYQIFAKQIFPGKTKEFLAVFNDCIATKFGYLVVDLDPRSDRKFQLRSKILPSDAATVVYSL